MRARLPLVGLLLALAVFAACRGTMPPMRFYTLTPLEGLPGEAANLGALGLSVGVGPLEIPRGIDRPNIVTRTGSNTLDVAEFDRWGGTLQGDMLQVLTQNLSVLLGSDKVVAYPWTNFLAPEVRVPLEVHRFDGTLGKEVVLNVTWGLSRFKARTASLVRRSVITEPVAGPGYADLVEASSRALASLSQEIAAQIQALRD